MEVSNRSTDDIASDATTDSGGGSTIAYSREEMLIIKETPLAKERPSFLLLEFNEYVCHHFHTHS